MTREEAFERIYPWGKPTTVTKSDADQFLDRLVALDLLKLDEAKSAKDRAYEIISPIIGSSYAAVVVHDLESAGLKIVEK